MNHVLIEKKAHEPGVGWTVMCVSEINGATRRGTEFVDLPDTATDAEIKAAIIAKYTT